MLKLFFIITFLFNTSALEASSYDNDVLEIFSKILPRFILMSNQKEQSKSNIKICIIHQRVDQTAAIALTQKIHRNYPDGLDGHSLGVIRTDFLHVRGCKNSQLIFVMDTPKAQIANVILYAKSQHALTASYDNALLDDGIELSLFLGRRVVPYINIKALKNSGIELDNILLRVSKIYMKMDK